MAYSDKVWKNAPDYTTPLSAAGLNDWEARIKAETDALEVLAVNDRAQTHPGEYLAAYNGSANVGSLTGVIAGSYAIGFATSEDGGRSFRRIPGGPFLQKSAATAWDDGDIKDPSLCFVGRRLFLAYMGTSDGATNSIGLAVWNSGVPSGTPDVRVQLVAPSAGWKSGSLNFPHLYYDESTGVLHLWYSGQTTTGGPSNSSIGHATINVDTLAVTQDAGNPILAPEAGEDSLVMGCVFLDAGTWHMFVGAFNTGATACVPVRFTASALAGAWTRAGQVYTPRTTATASLAANAASGDTQVQVANSAVFTVGDAVYVQDSLTATNPGGTGADNWEVNYVKALPDGTHVTLRTALTANYTTARSAEIVAVDSAKVMIRACNREGSGYLLHGTGWYQGNQTYHEESLTFTTPALATSPYVLARDRGLMLTRTGSIGATRGAWDKTSSENPSVIPYARGRQLVAALERSSRLRQMKGCAAYSLASATWTGLKMVGPPDTGIDGWLPAKSGDVIRISPAFLLDSQAVYFYMDVVVVLYAGGASTYGNWASGGSGGTAPANGQGIFAWRTPASASLSVGPPILYTVQDADVILGRVGLRPMYKLSGGTRDIVGTGTEIDLRITYENLGGGDDPA